MFWLLALLITFYHSISTVVVFFSSFKGCFSCVFGYVIVDFVAFLFFPFFAGGGGKTIWRNEQDLIFLSPFE